GAPTAAGLIPVTVIGESLGGNDSCDTEFKVAYRSIKVVGFGGADYSGTSTTHSMYRIMKSSLNFGTTGTVPTQSISIVDGGTLTVDHLVDAITEKKADIIIIGYNAHLPTAANTTLVDFIENKKGFVLMMAQDASSSDGRTLSAIMHTTVNVDYPPNDGSCQYGGCVRQFNSLDNPLIKGPFFPDLGGKYWGEDASTTYGFFLNSGDNLESHGFEALSTNTIMWKKNANFVYIGDGGFGIGDHNSTAHTIYPCAITSNGVPRAKAGYYYASNPHTDVYNSYFFANIIAYAIKWVQENR
ncbi:MAG: hypothetical protein LBS50_00780, partial [Prevotellaceae bacterium]|nr:hypothetical protein [Prevotellaceae bacterium]